MNTSQKIRALAPRWTAAAWNGLVAGGSGKAAGHGGMYFRGQSSRQRAPAGAGRCSNGRHRPGWAPGAPVTLPPTSATGMAQGHDGINYSLASREILANLMEIHAGATPFDGAVFLSSCDKAVPAQLMAMGRINIPAIMATGGVMGAGPDLLTLEQIGTHSRPLSARRNHQR